MTIIPQDGQQLDPIAVKRAAYTTGLRALADILDAHPELPLPYDGTSSALDWIEVGVDARRSAAAFARVMPGTVAKSVSDVAGQFYLTFQLHGLSLRVISTRAQMCERVITGTRTIVVEEPDPDALALVPKIKRTEVVEDVEWQCHPILAAEQPSAGS
jgi:hypothetical protein